ncbi:unnamed protein product [Discosporangium mesarthrocarpum]
MKRSNGKALQSSARFAIYATFFSTSAFSFVLLPSILPYRCKFEVPRKLATIKRTITPREKPKHQVPDLYASTSESDEDEPDRGLGGGLILGLNRYSHDSSVCVVSLTDGSRLFAGEKERITRVKHDGGDTGELVNHALESIGASLDDVRLVVSNNHHHRVKPFERRLPWTVPLGIYPPSYISPSNLLPEAEHIELSHHLAHAWCAADLAPFPRGLVVVMDGMGEAYGAMARAEADLVREVGKGKETEMAGSTGDPECSGYYNDLRLLREMGSRDGEVGGGVPEFQQVPAELHPHEAYREAESAYTFTRGPDGRPILTPVFKRWTMERSPSELYNHGFENMESLGAVYSRVSSHIFGDWNACGEWSQ